MSTLPTLPAMGSPDYWKVVAQRYRLRNPERARANTNRYYLRHPERKRARYEGGKKRRIEMKQALIAERKDAGCFDCKTKYAHWILQFDHVPERGVKLFPINPRGRSSMGNFKLELAKCDVVCANCHADRTYLRQKEK